MPLLSTLALVIACAPPAPPPLPSPATWAAPSDPVSLQVLGGVDRPVWVRWVSEVGATVPGPPATVEVVASDGQVTTVELTPGVGGYATYAVEAPGRYTVRSADTSARVDLHPFAWAGLGLERAEAPVAPAADADLVAAGAGVVLRAGGELWWLAPDAPAHRVLEVAQPILGARAAELDGDGVTDLLAWTARGVFLLRGRAGGGLSHVGTLDGGGALVVAGAAAGDLSDDGVVDLVVAWRGGEHGGQLDLWRGDGELGFAPWSNRALRDPPVDVDLGVPGDGTPEITVLNEAGTWARFYPYRAGLARSGPGLELALPGGGVHHARDLLGTGADALVFVDRPTVQGTRRVRAMDLIGPPRELELDRPSTWLAIVDIERGGPAGLLFSDADGAMVWTRAGDTAGSTSTSLLARPGERVGGPVGVAADGALLLARGEAWPWARFDAAGASLVASQAIDTGVTARQGRFGVRSRAGAGAAVVVVAPQVPALQLWSPAGELQAQLSIGPEPLGLRDLAVCGSDAWVALERGLLRVALDDVTAPVVVGEAAVVGDTIVCDVDGTGVALRAAEGLFVVSDALAVDPRPPVQAGAVALRAGALESCAEIGCALALAPSGAVWSRAVGRSGELVVDGVLQASEAVGWAPAAADVDGDGSVDLALVGPAGVSVLRALDGVLAAPEHWALPPSAVGGLRWGDPDGAGADAPWWADAGTGRVMYAPSSPAALPQDTGAAEDTGALGG